MKPLEINTSLLIDIDFATSTNLSCLFFFLFIDLYSLISAVIAQIFNPIAELVIPIVIPSKITKTEIEIHQYNAELQKPFCAFYSSICFALFLQGNNFLFHLYLLI